MNRTMLFSVLPRVCAVLATSLSVVSVDVSRAFGQADRGELSLKHLPADVVAAAFVLPRRLGEAPRLELLPFELVKATGEREFGFDPMTIESAIGFVVKPRLPSPPEAGLILRFSKPVALAEKLTAGTEPAVFAGTSYHRGRFGAPSFCLLPDGTTLLVAEDSLIQSMIATDRAESQLHTMLSEASTDDDLTAMLVFSPLRDMARGGLDALPELPPGLESLRTLPDDLDSVVATVNLSNDRPATIRIKATSPESAERLERTLLDCLRFGKQMALAEAIKSADADSEDPFELAGLQYMQRLADVIESRLKPRREGDTLTVTIQSDYATSGLLVALLLPAVQAAREAARRVESMNNLKQIALGMHNYHDVHGKLPDRASQKDGKAMLSWRVHILPYVEEQALYEQFHLDEPWDSPHNKQLIEKMPDVYRNPNGSAKDFRTNYLVLTGKQTIFEGNEGRTLASITDGTSNTVWTVEANPSQAVEWTKPEDLEFNPGKPMAGLGGLRPGGFLVGMADGSVRFIAETIDHEVLKALMTRDGGEVLGPAGF